MKRGLILAGSLMLCGLAYLRAETKDKAKNESYQPGTVVTVDKSESTYPGSPDAPLEPDVYSYDIGVRVDCTIYVGRYESAFDYLPSPLAPHHQVEVLLHKHILYVRMPELDREVKMSIVGHKRVNEDACRAKG